MCTPGHAVSLVIHPGDVLDVDFDQNHTSLEKGVCLEVCGGSGLLLHIVFPLRLLGAALHVPVPVFYWSSRGMDFVVEGVEWGVS